MNKLKVIFINGASVEVDTKDFHKTDSKIVITTRTGRNYTYAPWYIASSNPVA